MTWATFFKSRSFKYGSILGGIGFAAGTGGSAAIALRMASQCSSAAAYIISVMGKNITISELTTVVHYQQYNVPIELEEVDIDLPTDWVDLVNHVNELPPLCFSIPFTLGVCLTAVASLALASTIGLALHLGDEQRQAPLLQELEGVVDGDGADEDPSLLRPT
jgi:hypothetical protein